MDTKELYWGENDFHEFWESEGHEWLILRNHPEKGMDSASLSSLRSRQQLSEKSR